MKLFQPFALPDRDAANVAEIELQFRLLANALRKITNPGSSPSQDRNLYYFTLDKTTAPYTIRALYQLYSPQLLSTYLTLNNGSGDTGIFFPGFAIGVEASTGHLVFTNDTSGISNAGIFAHFDTRGNFEIDTNVAIGGSLYVGGGLSGPGIVQTAKFTVVHTALQTAALTNDIQLLSLPANTRWMGCVIRPTIAFAGGMAAYNLSIGISGSLTKYMQSSDVTAAITNQTGFVDSTHDVPDFVNPVSIRLAAQADANLDTSTDGSVDIQVNYCTLL